MDKKTYLEKYKLINEYYKRNNYIITEAPNDNNGGGIPDPSMDMGMGNGQDMGGQQPQNDPMGGGMPDMGMDPNMQGGEQPMDRQSDANMDMPDPSAGATGFEPQGQMEQDPQMAQQPVDSGEEEEVIDVDDLTDSQEDTEKKVDNLTNKFDKLFQMIGSFEEKINQSDAKINDLKQELEKRNPTQIEKMSMRSQTGYPFNVSPDEYWDEKEQTSNYSRDDDENGTNLPQYQITKNDVDNMTDWASISKSLDKYGAFSKLDDIFDF